MAMQSAEEVFKQLEKMLTEDEPAQKNGETNKHSSAGSDVKNNEQEMLARVEGMEVSQLIMQLMVAVMTRKNKSNSSRRITFGKVVSRLRVALKERNIDEKSHVIFAPYNLDMLFDDIFVGLPR